MDNQGMALHDYFCAIPKKTFWKDIIGNLKNLSKIAS